MPFTPYRTHVQSNATSGKYIYLNIVELIQVDKEVFFQLVEETVQRIMEQQTIKEYKWITADEAMDLLRIKSKSTLQKLRDEGKVRYTQPERKYILYDRDSILSFLEKNAKEPFA